MNIFKTLIIFVAVLFLGTTILTTAKEVEEVDYPSSKSKSHDRYCLANNFLCNLFANLEINVFN